MTDEFNGRAERFWLWLRLNLYTEGISKATHVMGSRQQSMLDEMEEMREEMTAMRAALGDLRRHLDLPAGVEMQDVDTQRLPSGDPTGL